jgi:hypothetical protein
MQVFHNITEGKRPLGRQQFPNYICYMASNGRMIMNEEFGRVWKKLVMASLIFQRS